MQRWQFHKDGNAIFGPRGTPETLIVENTVVFLTRKVFMRLWVNPLHLKNKKCTSHFCRETANKNKQFKETKTLLSDLYFIRKSFSGYRWKSGIVIFTWRVNWNNAYSPFNCRLCLVLDKKFRKKINKKSYSKIKIRRGAFNYKTETTIILFYTIIKNLVYKRLCYFRYLCFL